MLNTFVAIQLVTLVCAESARPRVAAAGLNQRVNMITTTTNAAT